jgi:hypothetical protein
LKKNKSYLLDCFGHMVVSPRIEVKVPARPTTPGLAGIVPIKDNGIIKSTKSCKASLAAWRVSPSASWTSLHSSLQLTRDFCCRRSGCRRWILYKFIERDETSPRSQRRGAFSFTKQLRLGFKTRIPCEFNYKIDIIIILQILLILTHSKSFANHKTLFNFILERETLENHLKIVQRLPYSKHYNKKVFQIILYFCSCLHLRAKPTDTESFWSLFTNSAEGFILSK